MERKKAREEVESLDDQQRLQSDVDPLPLSACHSSAVVCTSS